MRSKGTAGLLVCVLVAAALAPARAAIDANTATHDSSTPAAPAAARVSVIAGGTMTVTRGNDRATAPATVNSALLPGDAFATSGSSTHAEIQFDGYTALRLSGDVRGSFAAGDAHARRIEISSGLTDLSLWRGQNVDTEIVTPALTLRTHYAGSYRIDVAADGTTSVTARSGQADAVVPEKTYALVSGQTLAARVWAGKVSVKVGPAIARDDFDEFNQSRDRVLAAALDDNAHVPANLAGYDDLAGYGNWATVAPYGDVWVPQQTAGWAPYRDGNWDYDTGYGWTWVGSEPWGWVPYHYGSWIYSNPLGWCWYPPPIGLTPVWAPGLVAFFGYGAGPFGYSGYGWVPLAPYEPYYPWYPYYWYPYRYPPPPPKPKQHRPPKMTPGVLTEYRNARAGGASTIGARGFTAGLTAHPVAIDPVHLPSAKLVEGTLPMTPPHVQVTTASASAAQPAVPVRAAPVPAVPVHAAPAHAAAPWADEFIRAATILDGVSLPASHAAGQLQLPTMREIHAISPTLRETPVMHAGPPVVHQVPPAVRPASPPTIRVDPPVSTRLGGSRPPA